jgi:fatty acid desaturase
MDQTIDPVTRMDSRTGVTRRAPIADDKDMLRAARDLTKDLAEARPGIYWPDMLISAGIGFAGIAGAILAGNAAIAVLCGLIGALALYRALMFIHELTHIHKNALPGFRR